MTYKRREVRRRRFQSVRLMRPMRKPLWWSQGGSVPETLHSDDLSLKLLRLLAAEPAISQRRLARELGISLGKANSCVRVLLDRGWIRARDARDDGNRRAYAYALTAAGLRQRVALTLEHLRRKQREYADLEREIEELRHEAARLNGGGA